MEPGRGGFPEVTLKHSSGSSAQISLSMEDNFSNAPLTIEILYLSEKADFTPGKAIRGGSPIIFPWFGKKAGEKASHGFARNMLWELLSVTSDGSSASLRLKTNDQTRAVKPIDFEFITTYTLSKILEISASIKNCSDTPLEFSVGFHTYFNCADIGAVEIRGLSGCTFIDTTKVERPEHIQKEDPLKIIGEVDRIYKNVPSSVHGIKHGPW